MMSRSQATRSVGSITALECRETVVDEADLSNDDVFVTNTQSQPVQSSRTKPSARSTQPQKTTKENKQYDFYNLPLRERISSMFLNEELADVHFLVGNDGEQMRFAAHRYVLALGSCVFNAMLYGDLSSESRTFEISIPDIQPRAFYFVLRYLYTDEPEVEANCAASIYYAAKKYLIDRLAAACVRVFEEDLMHSNACALLANALLFDEAALTEKCLRLIDAQADLVLSSESFRSAERHIIATILDRDSLVITSELNVFSAVQRWSIAECERRGLEPTSDNQRASLDGSSCGSNDDKAEAVVSNLNSLLHKVRVPCIDLQDYANVVVPSGILSLKEVSDVFMWQVASQKPALPFICSPRVGLQAHRCSRFQSCAHRRNQWRYLRGKCDAVAFTVDRPIYLFAVGLYGSSGGSCEYSIRVEVKQQLKQTVKAGPRPCGSLSDCMAVGMGADSTQNVQSACSSSNTNSNSSATVAHSNLIVHSTAASVTINNPIFGSGSAQAAATTATHRNYALLLQHVTKFRTDGSSSVFDVRFPHALQIAADTLYHVSVVLDGAELSYFGQDGLADVQCDDVNFQFHCSPDSTNGTGVQGGQIPTLIFYV